jgi:hypothetical protein
MSPTRRAKSAERSQSPETISGKHDAIDLEVFLPFF